MIKAIRHILFFASGFIFVSSITEGKTLIHSQLVNTVIGAILFSIALSTIFYEFKIETKKSYHNKK